MKKLTVFLVSMLAAGSLFADSIELADGRVLEGDFVGSSNGIIMFDTGEGIEAFPEDEVVGMWFSAGVASAQAAAAETGPAPTITVPAGTRLVITMSEAIDSSRHGAGHRFRAQLESAVVVDGVTVLPRGTMLHGQITTAQQSRRATGSSELTAEFTDVMVDDVLYPIATTGLSARTGNEAGRTAGRTARGAALGGLIGGSSGARTGAQVGVGTSILTGGQSVNIPRGTIVETTLRVGLTLPM